MEGVFVKLKRVPTFSPKTQSEVRSHHIKTLILGYECFVCKDKTNTNLSTIPPFKFEVLITFPFFYSSLQYSLTHNHCSFIIVHLYYLLYYTTLHYQLPITKVLPILHYSPFASNNSNNPTTLSLFPSHHLLPSLIHPYIHQIISSLSLSPNNFTLNKPIFIFTILIKYINI